MSKKTHMEWTEIIKSIRNAGWGIETEKDKEEIEKELLANYPKMAAWGIMELLNQLDGIFGKAKPQREIDRTLTIDDDTAVFPGKNVGDCLYYATLGEGLDRHRIIAVDEDGHCMVVHEYWDLEYPPRARLASEYDSATEKEAIQRAATSDDEYHAERAARAKRALNAVENDEDLSEYTVAWSPESKGTDN